MIKLGAQSSIVMCGLVPKKDVKKSDLTLGSRPHDVWLFLLISSQCNESNFSPVKGPFFNTL